jgi:hypothetical protein
VLSHSAAEPGYTLGDEHSSCCMSCHNNKDSSARHCEAMSTRAPGQQTLPGLAIVAWLFPACKRVLWRAHCSGVAVAAYSLGFALRS